MTTPTEDKNCKKLDGIILMGPFGSGKTYLDHHLRSARIADYTELEPIVYDLFGSGPDFDLEQATGYLRHYYIDALSSGSRLVALESTGVVQRPLILELIEKYEIALVRVYTPKEICLARIRQRNRGSKRPMNLAKAAEFFDYWTNDIAPTYRFMLEVDGTDVQAALQDIRMLTTGDPARGESC